MNNFFIDAGKWWLEWMGRNKPTSRYVFSENEIISPVYPIIVSYFWKAIYMNLHPTHYAVAIAPDGRVLNLRGGYNRLSPGKYIVHYIDKQNRVMNIPLMGEKTYDGDRVALEVEITYRVVDPIKALEVGHAVDTLQGFIQSDVKEFVRTHTYNEIKDALKGRKLEDEPLAKYIKQQQARRYPLSKLFFIADVVIREKIEDPKVSEVREKNQLSQRQIVTQSEIKRRNLELEKKVAEQEAMINQLKADAANLHEIIQKMETQKTELEEIISGVTVSKKENIPSRVNIKKNKRVFISYSRIDPDRSVANEIHKYLCELECTPWMDVYDLIPGQDWELEIPKHIRNSDFFIVCLSDSSVSKAGFMQKELKEANSVLAELPEGRIFIIPIRLDNCAIPDSLRKKHWLDWSTPNAKELLLRAIESIDN
jgi:uncharacterized coiled-coil protein SlyX